LPLLGDSASVVAFTLIETIGELGLWFALLNLIPLPPFTGSHLLVALFPQCRSLVQRSHVYAALLFVVIAWTGVVTNLLEPVYRALARLVLGG
jgi:Zn-dependent protease